MLFSDINFSRSEISARSIVISTAHFLKAQCIPWLNCRTSKRYLVMSIVSDRCFVWSGLDGGHAPRVFQTILMPLYLLHAARLTACQFVDLLIRSELKTYHYTVRGWCLTYIITGIQLWSAMAAHLTKVRGGSVITFCRQFQTKFRTSLVSWVCQLYRGSVAINTLSGDEDDSLSRTVWFLLTFETVGSPLKNAPNIRVILAREQNSPDINVIFLHQNLKRCSIWRDPLTHNTNRDYAGVQRTIW